MSTEKQWFAIHTGSRKEKFVVNLLERKQIESYLPLVTRTKRYASRVKSHEIPLISCYVFVRITSDERVSVLETEYVHGFIKFTNEAAIIPPHEIDLLRQIVGHFDDVEVADRQIFAKGQRVELIAGELTGIKGTVLEERGGKRYLVKLESLDIHLTWIIKTSHLRKVT